MKTTNRKNDNKGYAILFTVVIVGIISMITIGLSNAAYKQTMLSSVARDSTIAFYQADIGSECALYADKILFFNVDQDKTEFNCAGHSLQFQKNVAGDFYQLLPENPNSLSKCFRIEVSKDAALASTEIQAKGYNYCNKSNFRTVERGIKVTY